MTCGEWDSHEAAKKRNITVCQGKNCASLSYHCHNSERILIFVIDDGNRYLVIATRRNRRRLSALSRMITRRAKRLIIASDRTNEDRKTCFQHPCIVSFVRARYSNTRMTQQVKLTCLWHSLRDRKKTNKLLVAKYNNYSTVG